MICMVPNPAAKITSIYNLDRTSNKRCAGPWDNYNVDDLLNL